MGTVIPPNPALVESIELQTWHTVNKIPWDTLVGLNYVRGAALILHAGQVDALTASAGEVSLDNTDSTREEKELSLTGEDVWLVSTSASDTSAVIVQGVNSDGDCMQLVTVLTGTTPVQVISGAADDAWFNINRIFNGGAVPFVGDVFCSTKSDAGVPANTDDIQAKMPIGSEYASNTMVMCGNNEVLVFTGIDVTAAKRDEIAIFISRRLSNTKPWIKAFKVFAFEGFLPYRFIVPVVLTEGQKIAFTGSATTNNTDMTWQSSYYSLAQDTGIPNDEGINVLFKSV